jgi:penicillin-binding protein 1A
MRKLFKILWIMALGMTGFFILLLLLINFRVIGNMVSIEALKNPRSVLTSEIIAVDGTVLGKYCQVDSAYTYYGVISKDVINALIATEDVRFFSHSGIEFSYIMKIPYYLIIGKGKNISGTITQQLARRLLVSNGSVLVTTNIIARTFQKMQEWLLTIKLERNFTKQEIITLYLNGVPFGDSIYGVQNAAGTFFSKDASHLSLEEAATLVGMLRGKDLYNPYRNLNISRLRRNVVIDLMQKNDVITQAEANEAKSKHIVLRYSAINYYRGLVPHFRDILREELKAWCKEYKKADGTEYDLCRDGLKIYTTINPRMDIVMMRVDSIAKSVFVIGIKDRYGNILQTVAKKSDQRERMTF